MQNTQGALPDPAAGSGVDDVADSELRLAPDGRWWPAVAALVRDLGRDPENPDARDLRRVVVIVPGMLYAPMLREALHDALGGDACIAPRVLTLDAWADVEPALVQKQRAELFQALRESTWVRERFGSQAGALWALARDIAFLSDELTLAACGAAEAFEGRWRAAVEHNFSHRAAAAGDLQSQLVLALWRAGLSPELGAAHLRERLEQRARRAEGPLVWLAPQGAAPWQHAFCRAYSTSSRQPACLVVADPQALGDQRPWLLAAWPELTAPDAMAPPIAARARSLALTMQAPQSAVQRPQLQILRRDSLEEEAAAAAGWTVDRLRAGCRSIALVALDRLTARRVRALLDRAGILVADESGWKLSTTSAAAAVMRWIDLVISDFEHRDLLDWLRSPFTLACEDDKATIVESIGSALLEDGVHAGMPAVRTAVARRARAGAATATAAQRVIEQMVGLAHSWQASGSLGRFLGLLNSTFDQMGMRLALAADPVGRNVLTAVQQLHDQLIGSPLRLDLVEFRALLAEHFEELGSGSRDIDSPVVMTTLAGTRLRRFDAALLIGADADHLPGTRSSGGLLANSVRRELGLRTEADSVREQTLDLAGLLATAPAVAATWRCRRHDEPLPLSPLLDRLVLLTELAGLEPLVHGPIASWHHVPATVSLPRTPSAAGLLPQGISASACQDLIDCPYRFFGLRMLGLRDIPRLRPKPDKRDFGLLLHAVLFEYHRTSRPDTQVASVGIGAAARADATPRFTPGAAHVQLRRVVDELFAPLLQQQPALIGYRQRLRTLLPGYVEWLRTSEQAGWRWQAGELMLRRPWALAGGGGLELQGRIDRIDVNAQGQRRILDYKARDVASLRKSQREPGEDVKLLFYGLLLDPPAQEAAYLSVQRPPDPRIPGRKVVNLVPAPAPFAEHVSALATRLGEDLARIAAGASLPANGAETICRRCELRSLCRRGFTAPESKQRDDRAV